MSADPPRERAAISTDGLVATALTLSRDHGLNGWTVRDLERHAAASPSSIYHHIGSREALCERVVEAIVASVAVPHEIDDWQDFFRVSCGRVFTAVTPYPGTAAWLMMHGPVLGPSARAVDVGIERLRVAGIEPAGLAYSQIVNSAMGVIASGDERRRRASGHHAQIVRRLDAVEPSDQGEGARTMGRFLSVFADPAPTARAAARRAYFEATVDVVLAGVEAGYRAGTVRGRDRFAPARSAPDDAAP